MEKTRHRSDIKKLSTAILRGLKIARENGIKQIKNSLFKFNEEGELCGACALGMAYIGTHGTKSLETQIWKDENPNEALESLKENLGTSERNACLLKTVSSKTARNYFSVEPLYGVRIDDFVATLNDHTSITPEKIAEKLKSCKL